MFGSVCFWIFSRFAIFNYFTAEPVRITVFLNEFLRAQLTVELCYFLINRFNRSSADSDGNGREDYIAVTNIYFR